MFGKCENCARRGDCRSATGVLFGGCQTDYRPKMKRSDWIVNVNDAARKCVAFAAAVNPFDGFLSDWDYPDHMRGVRNQLRDGEQSAWDVLRETRSVMIEYDEDNDGEHIDDGVRETYADAIKALYVVLRNYWCE